MINGLYNALESYQGTAETQARPEKVLRMVKNERMGGSVPVWETVSASQKHGTANAIETALTSAKNTSAKKASDTALAYQPIENPTANAPEEFGFGDLIDMVNPLHHVPVVGHAYRELTGDEIKPIGQIIGGAIFGGPIGAASGLINVVIEEETGKDVAGNAMAMVFNGEAPALRTHDVTTPDSPETRLAAISNTQGYEQDIQDLPGNLLSFVDMKSGPEIVIKRLNAADGRTAGTFEKSYPKINENPLPVREPITQVRLSNYNN